MMIKIRGRPHKYTIKKENGKHYKHMRIEMELSQVHRIEKGKINPTLTTLNALARGLKISLAELVG